MGVNVSTGLSVSEVEHYMCANFHFVDLAGSERAHRTGNVGDRFKGKMAPCQNLAQ